MPLTTSSSYFLSAPPLLWTRNCFPSIARCASSPPPPSPTEHLPVWVPTNSSPATTYRSCSTATKGCVTRLPLRWLISPVAAPLAKGRKGGQTARRLRRGRKGKTNTATCAGRWAVGGRTPRPSRHPLRRGEVEQKGTGKRRKPLSSSNTKNKNGKNLYRQTHLTTVKDIVNNLITTNKASVPTNTTITTTTAINTTAPAASAAPPPLDPHTYWEGPQYARGRRFPGTRDVRLRCAGLASCPGQHRVGGVATDGVAMPGGGVRRHTAGVVLGAAGGALAGVPHALPPPLPGHRTPRPRQYETPLPASLRGGVWPAEGRRTQQHPASGVRGGGDGSAGPALCSSLRFHHPPHAGGAEFGWRRSAARTCLVAVEVLISLVLPDFKAILNLVGGSTIAIMSFVMPPLCYLRLSAAKNPVGLPFRNVGVWERVVLWGVVVMGVAQSLVTSYTATSSFMSWAVLQRSFSGVTKAEPPAWSYGSRAASVILVSASQVVSGAYHVLFFFAV
ncbi:uncharacterized protein LOC135101983 isoform X2 [Scylla paramamosain]|uniref:uncharacterized protein LOC135101983 isoform X2 n=1 Tax=Scylla paramamosain TaxID=85552 RepID=UPI003082D47B